MNLPDRFISQTTRYVLGRRSYGVGEHCDWLVAHWREIPEFERECIRMDVEVEFLRDDQWRAGHPSGHEGPLGMDMDRQEWEHVRKLWTVA